MMKAIMNKLFPPYEPKVTQPKEFTQQIIDEIAEFGRREQCRKDFEQHKKDVIETMTQSILPDYDKKQFDNFLNTMDKYSDDQVLKILAEFMENKESKTLKTMEAINRSMAIPTITTNAPSIPTPPLTPLVESNPIDSFTDSDIGKILIAKNRIQQFATQDLSGIIFTIRKYGLVPTDAKFYIAGGVFTSLLLDEPINDIDLFVVNDYTKLFKRSVIDNMPTTERVGLAYRFKIDRWSTTEYMGNPKIHSTLHIKATTPYSDLLMQRNDINVVCTTYKTREELMDHFDFLHCKVSYDPFANKLFCSKETYDAIVNKRLIAANKTKKPKNERIEKFLKRGFVYETTVAV